jgi:hypothetical protein
MKRWKLEGSGIIEPVEFTRNTCPFTVVTDARKVPNVPSAAPCPSRATACTTESIGARIIGV